MVQIDESLDLFYCSFLFQNGFLYVPSCTYPSPLVPHKQFLSNSFTSLTYQLSLFNGITNDGVNKFFYAIQPKNLACVILKHHSEKNISGKWFKKLHFLNFLTI